MPALASACTTFVLACSFAPGRASDGDAGSQPDTLPTTCTPEQRACEGRTLRTCGADSSWDPAQDMTCAFTCSAGACVEPSNVGDVSSCGPGAPMLAPPVGATVVLSSDSSGAVLTCAPHCGTAGMTEIQARGTIEAGTIDVTWFCLSAFDVPAGVTIERPPSGGPADAIAFVVDGTVAIAGAIDFGGGTATSSTGGEGAPGAGDGGDRTAGDGQPGAGPCPGSGGDQQGVSNNYGAGGGAGAGGSTGGAAGGDGRSPQNNVTGTGASATTACGTAALQPLAGGGGGGGGADGSCGGDCGWPGGGGGGALQISSRVAIAITGALDASGGDGYGGTGTQGNGGGGGGGAGGGILLEAPSITISGTLDVDGGNGGQSAAGPGGTGATGSSPAMMGASFAAAGQGGGGGGGGGGRVRIRASTPTCVGVTPTAACTTATL